MKIVYFGNHNVGCLCLKKLVEKNIYPALVVVQELDFREHLKYASVKETAEAKNLATFVYNSSKKADLITKLKELKPDMLLSVAWRHLFKKDLLDIPRLGAINFHSSLLPRCRGANPTNWAIISGEKDTGVTVHFIDEGVDTGDIIIQKRIPITTEDTAYTLRMKQDKISEKLMEELIKYILYTGKFPRIKQDHTKATFFKKRSPKDGVIQWNSMTTERLHNFVRAQTRPYPGAYSYVNDRKILFWEVLPQNINMNEIPGKVISLDSQLPKIATLDGCVTLLDFECDDMGFKFDIGMCCK